MSTTIIVGTDGSDAAQRAVEWCAAHARDLNAEVLVLNAISAPTYTGIAPPYIWLPSVTPEQREARSATVAREWCKPLVDAGVPFRIVLADGDPAPAILDEARRADAAIVVTGRRGRGGLRTLLLGSTTHHLSHHLDRPLVIVP